MKHIESYRQSTTYSQHSKWNIINDNLRSYVNVDSSSTPLHRAMQFYTTMKISIISKNTSYSNRFSYIFESMTLIFSYRTLPRQFFSLFCTCTRCNISLSFQTTRRHLRCVMSRVRFNVIRLRFLDSVTLTSSTFRVSNVKRVENDAHKSDELCRRSICGISSRFGSTSLAFVPSHDFSRLPRFLIVRNERIAKLLWNVQIWADF